MSDKVWKQRFNSVLALLLFVILTGCDGPLGAPDDSGIQRDALAISEGMRFGSVEPAVAQRRLRSLLVEVEETKARDPRNALAYSDAAYICVLLMEIDSSDVARCKDIYRRAIVASRDASDPAPVFNSASMLRSIKDDDALRWILGLGLLGDAVMTSWSIEAIGDLAEEAARVDPGRADFLIRNLATFCGDTRLLEELRLRCRQRLDVHIDRVDAAAAVDEP